MTDPCDRCARKIWDPKGDGFILHCFGHLDGKEIFVPTERKKKYSVKGCEMFFEDLSRNVSEKTTHTTQRVPKAAAVPVTVPEKTTHTRHTAKPRIQSTMEVFCDDVTA